MASKRSLVPLVEPFNLTSSNFPNNATQLPNSMVSTVAGCSYPLGTGNATSPQLSWSNVPTNTKSFVLILYDKTASYMHWGVYDINEKVSKLPMGAGNVNVTKYGTTVENSFGDKFYAG